jgi:phosphoribosylformylglycinamidine cyclo-ligase
MAHITGGGLVENIPRVLPDGVKAVLQKEAWDMPPLFQWLQQQGNVDEKEMSRVFNCGIGMALIVGPELADTAMRLLQSSGETVWRIGTIRPRAANEAQTIIE